MFIWMIFLESLNILLPNLVWWCSIMSQSVMQNFFCVCAVFKVRVTVRAHMIKKDSFYYIFWTVDSLAAKLSLMIHHHKLECPVKKIGWFHSGSRSQRRGKMLMFVQMVSSEPPNKLGVVMNHYESECHAKILICYFQDQGHYKSSYDQNMTIFTVYFELLILLLLNLVW